MPKKTRKQKIAAYNKRQNMINAVTANPIPMTDIKGQDEGAIKPDRQTRFIKNDLIKTILITFFLILLELMLFKIRFS